MAPADAATPGVDPWEAFCDALKQAGGALRRPETPQDELTLAEGYRHLVRMIRAGFDITCEYGDPRHPEFFPMAERTLLSEGVTPDARYHQAFVDGRATHRITGQRGGAPLIELGLYTGRTGVHPTSDHQAWLTERELAVGNDGRFEVVLSPREHSGNWMRTDAETRYVFIRQYAHDWSTTQGARFEIRREDTSGDPPPPTLEQVRRGLEATAHFVNHVPAFWAAISDYWAGYAVNRIVAQEQADDRTDITVPVGHRFACGYFALEPDEALVVAFEPSDVPYWGLSLTNYWYEPIDWAEGGSHVNNRTVAYEPDGSVRLVVADARPPRPNPNWLDTKGRRQGTMVFRWSRSADPLPAFETRRVALAELLEAS